MLLADVVDNNPVDLERAAIDAFKGFVGSGWLWAIAVAKLHAAQGWAYSASSFADWCHDKLDISASYGHRCVRAGQFLLDQGADERERWLRIPLNTALESLDGANPLAIAEAASTSADARRRVKAERLGGVAAAGGDTLPHVRTISATVTKECLEDWRRLVNRVRIQLGHGGNPHPSHTAIISCVTATMLQDPQFDPGDKYVDDVDHGYARCWFPLPTGGYDFTVPHTGKHVGVCGSYSTLEKHHSIPRSQGQVGRDSELVWLCSQHHRIVSDGIDSKDWRWLRIALGYDAEG